MTTEAIVADAKEFYPKSILCRLGFHIWGVAGHVRITVKHTTNLYTKMECLRDRCEKTQFMPSGW